MINRRRRERRKYDRFKLAVGIFIGMAALGLTLQTSRCSKDGGLTSSPTPVNQSTPTPVAQATPTPQPVAPVDDPKTNLVPVTYDNVGNVHIENLSDIIQVKGECLFQVYDGGEQQIRRDEPDSIKISPKGVADFKLDVAVGCYQNDVIPGGDNCQNFNHADAAFFKDGKKVAHYSQLTGCNPPPKKCEPNEEWRDIEVVGDPIAGEQIRCPFSDQDGCFECFQKLVDVKQTNGCEERTIRRITDGIIRNQVECPCEEGNPAGLKDYDPPVWTGTIEEGECVYGPPQLEIDLQTIVNDEPKCHENGTQAWTVDYTCQEDREGSIRVCRQVQCPEPEGSCFYNNRGDDGKEECEALPGFVSWNEQNHLCELTFPGISDDDFQLNPGQSVEGCLSKHDD